MALIYQRPWTRQPLPPIALLRSNQLARTLTHFFPLNGSPLELVTGATSVSLAGTGAYRGDPRGLALRGDGAAACASIAVDLSFYSKLTLSFWMYWDAYANDDALAMEYTPNYNSSSGGFLIDPNSGAPASGQFQFGVGAAGGTPRSVSFARPSAAGWHHYAFLMDRAAADPAVAVYIDNVPQSLTGVSGSTVAGNFGNDTLYLFSRANSSLFGAGRMMNLSLRGGYLTNASEIAEEFARPWQIFAPVSRLLWAPSAQATIYRPASDVQTSGWYAVPGPNAYSMVNEAVLDRSNYNYSPILDGNAYSEILDVGSTQAAGSYNVVVDAGVTYGSALLRAYLLDSSNNVVGQSLVDQTLSNAPATFTLPVTANGSWSRIKYEVQ